MKPPADRLDWAIILAGGTGRRLGGVDKPGLSVGGRTLLQIALEAVAPAVTVVVGPARDLPSEIRQTRERPPGGGPAAGVAAGLLVLPPVDDVSPAPATDVWPTPATDVLVGVFAADLPGLLPADVNELVRALVRTGSTGSVLQDANGRRQYLAGVWSYRALVAAVGARASWYGARLSDLLDPLIGVVVTDHRREHSGSDTGPDRLSDVDTPADLQRWSIRPVGGETLT